MPTPKLTNEIINAAIDGYEFQKARIDTKIAELHSMLPGAPAESAATPEPAKRQRRKMSAAGRKAIAEAQRKRWAASKRAAELSAPARAEPTKQKRRISKAGMARIIAATKKRWRLQKAAAKAAAKKPAPARKKAAVKKAAKKAAPVKKVAVTKVAPKKTAPAAAQGPAETAAP